MNKLLTTVLMFSAMAAVVPTQAMETDSQKQTATTSTNQAQDTHKKGPQSFLLRHKKKALATAVILGTAAATATYLYAVPSVSPELNYLQTLANWIMPTRMSTACFCIRNGVIAINLPFYDLVSPLPALVIY